MTNIYLRMAFFLVVLWIPKDLWAGSIHAEIDKRLSSMDEPFWLTVSVQGSLDGDVLVPENKDFEITQTGQSTNISIVNGTMTREIQYSYQVRALKEGKLTIPALKAKVDDKDLQSEPIEVEVRGGTAPAQEDAPAPKDKLIFVERELPKTKLYEGEVLVSKVRLLTRAQLTGATPARDAAPDWRLIGIEGQKNVDVMRQGVRWSAIELAEALIPLKAGKLKVPSFGINATWIQPTPQRRAPRSVFDLLQNGFGQGQEVSKKIMSDPLDVTVRPLPAPKPQDFNDAVGSFTLSAQVSNRGIAVGETATVTLELKGQGALDRSKDIRLSVAGAKIYDDKPQLTEKVEPGAGLVSKKIFKFAVVPHTNGDVTLGTVRLSIFNPYTEQYESLKADLGALNVSGQSKEAIGAAPTVAATVPSQAPDEVKNLTPKLDLTPKALTSNDESKKPWYLSPLVLAVELLLLFAGFGFWLLRNVWSRTKVTTRQKASSKQKEIGNLVASLERGDQDSFDQGLLMLREQLALPGKKSAAMTSKDLLEGASKMTQEDQFLRELQNFCAHLDRISYGGSGVTAPNDSETLRTSLANLLKMISSKGTYNV